MLYSIRKSVVNTLILILVAGSIFFSSIAPAYADGGKSTKVKIEKDIFNIGKYTITTDCNGANKEVLSLFTCKPEGDDDAPPSQVNLIKTEKKGISNITITNKIYELKAHNGNKDYLCAEDRGIINTPKGYAITLSELQEDGTRNFITNVCTTVNKSLLNQFDDKITQSVFFVKQINGELYLNLKNNGGDWKTVNENRYPNESGDIEVIFD
ncbi:hypothetical protein [Okeania sp. SIO1I7]|uniref:hypothetical protein n=1 Tax=Okeania sp. SIO1I7 TaxID=2607772 RepID=UPI0013FCD4FF|nr:hypothetical protein [Okeania sp. SIO1I7]NET28973.1 hypothetical protein [Okeania sp. SIO1I7]